MTNLATDPGSAESLGDEGAAALDFDIPQASGMPDAAKLDGCLMSLLDTNVVSGLRKASRCDPQVAKWQSALPGRPLYGK